MKFLIKKDKFKRTYPFKTLIFPKVIKGIQSDNVMYTVTNPIRSFLRLVIAKNTSVTKAIQQKEHKGVYKKIQSPTKKLGSE